MIKEIFIIEQEKIISDGGLKQVNLCLGFTLIEMLIAVAIVGIISVAVSNFGRDIFYNNYVTQKALVAEGEAKLSLKKVVAELRTMAPSNTGTYPIESASKNSLVFYSDFDGDNLRERLRYFWSNGVLKRGATKPTGQPYTYATSSESVITAVNGLVNTNQLIFSYYDDSYNGSSTSTPMAEPIDIKNVRLIKIELLVDANPDRSPIPLYISSQVSLRNLKDNL